MPFQRDKQAATSGGFKRDKQATPEGEVGWLTPVDDAMRIAADSMTRGYADKLGGEEAQQHTARSRERTSDWVETPIDIAAAVAASPYRVGSMGVGALAGAAEGAASAYGHQEGWVPGWDVLKGAGEGAAFGAGGAKLGEWAGRGWNRMFGETPPVPAPTGEPKLSRVGSAVHSASQVPLTTTVPIDLALAHFGVPPIVSGTAKTARLVRPLFKPQLPPAARPLEPAAAAAARDALARMMIGYGRSP